ncbi:MAG: hypothetical protein AB8H79_03095 [Myxococcota bacterium]
MKSALVLLIAMMHGCGGDCARSAQPRLTVGAGEIAFEPLSETDPSYELIHGPQGGWHLLIGLDAAGLDARGVVVAEMQATIDGEVVARNEGAWLTFRCSEDTQTLQAWNSFLIFDPDRFDSPCSLHDKEVEVTVTVPDSKGDPLTETVTARIDDPRHNECEE